MNTLAQNLVSVPAASNTLAALGVTIDPGIQMLYLRPVGVVNYQFNGTAKSTSAFLPEGFTGFPVNATSAALFQFFSQSESLDVLQVG